MDFIGFTIAILLQMLFYLILFNWFSAFEHDFDTDIFSIFYFRLIHFNVQRNK